MSTEKEDDFSQFLDSFPAMKKNLKERDLSFEGAAIY